eukprot:CAMPEP_0116135228 /NCGR_PEP_ID=MMETSP0329-20121206/11080_1 /TAXON_ID=697910 /ORGANISM="Pseudo-nitzschia arenysensis, Strain B593" /LENGTH=216 /DNA_ID=CAMNT_0003630017 /DNA_START=105 /DNA_END=755 /DNA_ORIENTATION=+
MSTAKNMRRIVVSQMTTPNNDQDEQEASEDTERSHHDKIFASAFSQRRDFLRGAVGLVAASATIQSMPMTAIAAMKSDQTVFTPGKDLTVDEAKARFQVGQTSLDYLLKNYDEICEGGGDNIRRYLGTVGTTSGLYGIAKVMKTLQEEADDIVEYTETMNEVNAALVGADGSAYMAIFTESSTSGVPPKKYFDDAKIEVKRAIASMQEIAKQLNIK